MNSCTFGNLICVINDARGGSGNPIKPTYYIDAWAVLVIVIAAVIFGRFSARARPRDKP